MDIEGGRQLGSFDIYSGASGQVLTVLAGGNVGIGTTNPSFKLEVSGNFRTTSGTHTNFLATGAGSGDGLAEMNNASDVETIQLYTNGISYFNGGNVGIGTTTPDALLAVAGTIHSKEVKVDLIGWPDYVFKPKYHLPSLTTVKAYIDKNQRLPDMPSEQEVAKNGINLGEMVKVQTKKIEELTLYLIDQEKTNQSQQEQINQLKEQLASLTKALTKN